MFVSVVFPNIWTQQVSGRQGTEPKQPELCIHMTVCGQGIVVL